MTEVEKRLLNLERRYRELDENLTALQAEVRELRKPQPRGGGDIAATPAPQRTSDTY